MQPDELDRLLGAERPVSPSSNFAHTVMSRVMQEAATPKGIAFPWKPVLLGILTATGAVAAGLAMEPARPVLVGSSAGALTESLEAWTAHLAAAAVNPAISSLVLAALVTLIPVFVYKGYRYARG